MERFGDELKRAREARGQSLESIAQKTRISRRYLEALEASDLEALPGGAFDKGYIRAYAEVVGVDPAPFLTAYEREREQRGRGKEETESQLIEDLSRLVQKRDTSRFDVATLRRGVALVFAVLIVAISAWLISRGDETPPPASSTPEVRPAPEPRLRPRPEPDAVTAPSAARRVPRAASLPAPVPVPVPVPTPAATTVGSADITVPDAGVGRGVVERNLVGAGQRFAEGSTVVFWTRVVGASRGATIRHVWRHNGQIMMLSNLTVGGPHWRTFSRLVLPEGSSGGWEVEARDPDGNVLAQERFVCLEGSPGTSGEPGF